MGEYLEVGSKKFPLSNDELLELPLNKIVDGWLVDNSHSLYLFVEVEPGKVQTITIKRKK